MDVSVLHEPLTCELSRLASRIDSLENQLAQSQVSVNKEIANIYVTIEQGDQQLILLQSEFERRIEK